MSNIDRIAKLELAQQKLEIKKSLLFEAAINSKDPSEIIKAQTMLASVEKKTESERKSFFVDPLDFSQSFSYKDRKISLSYSMLKGMSKTPIINAILKTRTNQVASFAEPQKDEFSVGFKIRKRRIGGSQQEEKLTKQEEKEIAELTEFVNECGDSDVWGSDDFDSFIRKVVGDSLTYDQMTFEVEDDRKGVPVAFFPTDASTFRVADTIDFSQDDIRTGYSTEARKRNMNGKAMEEISGYLPSHVQVYQNQVVQHFYPWELCFGLRNPSNSIYNYGYGVSEMEELVSTITGLLWGEQYNRNFFKQGSAPKGFLRIKGDLPPSKLHSFRQMWNATTRGVGNSHKTPVMEADQAEWIDLQKNNRDMEFAQWMEFLIKVSCAIFTIDPAEINFPLQGGANSGAMFEGNNEARIKHSRDKGLYPILKFLQKKIDKYVIKRKNPKYEFVFVGLDAMNPKDQMEHDMNSVKTYKTVNEVRQSKGMKNIDGGDILLDPSFLQGQMMAGDDGMGEEEGGFGDQQEGEENDNPFAEEPEDNPFEKALNGYIGKLR